MYDILQKRSEVLRQEAVAFAQELVGRASVSLDEEQVALLIEERMVELGYDNVFRDSFGNVIGVITGREAAPTVLLNCHMDTTAVGGEDEWEESPCSAVIKDGKLYGRGASDCKGGLAAQVYAGVLLKRCLLPLKGNIVVAATVGEEKGSSVGVRGLMDETLGELGIEPSYAVLGEPTGLGLYYGHDGWLEMDIKIEGSSMFDVRDATRLIFDELENSSNGSEETEAQEELMTEKPCYNKAEGLQCATIGVKHRLNSSENEDHVMKRVKHDAKLAAQGVSDIVVEVQVREESRQLYTGTTTSIRHITHAWSIDPFDQLMEKSRGALLAAGCEVRPGKWELGRLGMGTAGGVLTKDYSVPTIGYGPGTEEEAHAINESVEVAKVGEAMYGTAAIVHSLIGVPVFGWTSDDI